MKDDAVYMRHILECIRRIEENVAGGRAKVWEIIERDLPQFKQAVTAIMQNWLS